MMTDNAQFWAGEFGDSYIERNKGEELLKSKEQMFRRMLGDIFYHAPHRIIEFGANIGMNIQAMKRIHSLSLCDYAAVEINRIACEQLASAAGVKGENVWNTTFQDPKRPWGNNFDLAISMGVLIHVEPEQLPACYEALFEASNRWILIAEYFASTPEAVTYRGEEGRLFRRDFGQDMLDLYRDRLSVLNYGFFWKHDPYIQHGGDITWWLFHKENS